MRNHTRVIFLTADQLEERAAERIRQAEQLPPGEARQHALKNAAQLRSYAAMKRLLVPERPGGRAKEPSDVGGDRVMRAYASKHDLTERQAAFVREEISKFIAELTAAPRRPPMMFPEADDLRIEERKNDETVGAGAR